MMGLLISSTVAMILQYICISKLQVIHLKYTQFLFVNYILAMVEEKISLQT